MFQWLPVSHRWKPRSLQWLEGPTSSVSFLIPWWTSHTTFFHVHFTLAITTSMLSLEHKTPLSQDLLRRVPTLRTLFSMCLCMTHSFTSSRSPYQWSLTQLLCMNYSLHILCFSSLHIIYHLLIYHIPLNFFFVFTFLPTPKYKLPEDKDKSLMSVLSLGTLNSDWLIVGNWWIFVEWKNKVKIGKPQKQREGNRLTPWTLKHIRKLWIGKNLWSRIDLSEQEVPFS